MALAGSSTTDHRFAAANVTTILLDPANAITTSRSSIALNGGSPTVVGQTQTGTPSASNPTRRLMVGALALTDSTAAAYIANTGWWAEIVVAAGADATEANRVLLRDYLNTKWAVY